MDTELFSTDRRRPISWAVVHRKRDPCTHFLVFEQTDGVIGISSALRSSLSDLMTIGIAATASGSLYSLQGIPTPEIVRLLSPERMAGCAVSNFSPDLPPKVPCGVLTDYNIHRLEDGSLAVKGQPFYPGMDDEQLPLYERIDSPANPSQMWVKTQKGLVFLLGMQAWDRGQDSKDYGHYVDAVLSVLNQNKHEVLPTEEDVKYTYWVRSFAHAFHNRDDLDASASSALNMSWFQHVAEAIPGNKSLHKAFFDDVATFARAALQNGTTTHCMNIGGRQRAVRFKLYLSLNCDDPLDYLAKNSQCVSSLLENLCKTDPALNWECNISGKAPPKRGVDDIVIHFDDPSYAAQIIRSVQGSGLPIRNREAMNRDWLGVDEHVEGGQPQSHMELLAARMMQILSKRQHMLMFLRHHDRPQEFTRQVLGSVVALSVNRQQAFIRQAFGPQHYDSLVSDPLLLPRLPTPPYDPNATVVQSSRGGLKAAITRLSQAYRFG